MILFNLIFSKNISELSDNLYTNSKYTVKSFKPSYRPIKKKIYLAYVVKSPDILLQSQKKLASENLSTQSLKQKLFNILWRQTVFLSISNKVSDIYSNQLTALSNYQPKNVKRSLVSKFSKSLFKGSISSSLTSIPDINSGTLSNIQYMWSQGLNFKRWNLLSHLFNKKSGNDSKSIKDYLFKNTSFNHFPLFTVSNSLGQMVISEPPEELNVKRNILDYLSFQYNTKYIYEGWFFTNYEDAKEYMQYINEYYGLKGNKLKIFTCSFSTFYTIVNKFNNQVNFRLIPDLKEIGQLIKKYRYYKNISFHHKQKYGKTYFQGQPLYSFQTADEHNYNYVSRDKKKYNLVFTNYETALNIWHQINSNVLSSHVKKMPNLVVYNLEYFIKDQVNSLNNLKYPFLLVPSKSSYKFTKEKQLRKNTKIAYDSIQSYWSHLQLWSKRIVWSLTSRQPNNW